MYTYNIEFEDISHSGHCITDVFGLECSIDKNELEELFDKACESTNFNFADEICDNYLDYEISIDYLHDLKEEKNVDLLSIVEQVGCYYDEDEESYDIEYSEDFLKIFLEFIRSMEVKIFHIK